MTLLKKCFYSVLFVSLFVLPWTWQANAKSDTIAAAKNVSVQSTKTTLEVKGELDAYARVHIQKANASLVPSKAAKSVTKAKSGGYVAEYKEIDADTLSSEIYESNTPGSQYVGHILYLEKTYQSVGATQDAAKNGMFRPIKARRIRELVRYDKGKWQD